MPISPKPAPESDASNTVAKPFFAASLPRLAGYGLFALFALDLIQLAASYSPFNASMDAQISMQILERSAIPIIAFVLIFLDKKSNPSRFSRAAMKLLSWCSLVAVFAYLALGGFAVTASIRIYRQNQHANMGEWTTKRNIIKQVDSTLGTITPQQAALVLREFIPASRPKLASMSGEQVIAYLKKELPDISAQAEETYEKKRFALLRTNAIFAGKYLLAGLMMSVIMLLIFENTRFARKQIVFEGSVRYPKMRVEGYVAQKAYRTWVSMERLGDLLLPDLTNFGLYRRLKRRFKKRK